MLHADSESAPTAVEYLPDPQKLHEAEPVLVLYVPAGHRTHGPPSFPLVPALHLHADLLLLAGGELESAEHAEQGEEPVWSLYFPAVQGRQGPASGPVYALLQEQ